MKIRPGGGGGEGADRQTDIPAGSRDEAIANAFKND
jgi:hypothetical protein